MAKILRLISNLNVLLFLIFKYEIFKALHSNIIIVIYYSLLRTVDKCKILVKFLLDVIFIAAIWIIAILLTRLMQNICLNGKIVVMQVLFKQALQ